MIGPLLSARFIAKKPWTVSALFFAIVFVLGIVASTVLPGRFVLLWIVGFIIFIGTAMYYLKTNFWLSLGMFIASWIINLIIGYGLAAVGIALPW